jgi:hypothetical protein
MFSVNIGRGAASRRLGILLLLFVFAVLLLAAYFYVKKPAGPERLLDTPANFSEEAFIAMINPSIEECERFTDSSLKDSCFYGLAVRTSDTTLCSLIQDSNMQAKCKAINTKDLTVCNTINNETQKSKCLRDVAEQYADASMCDTGGMLQTDQDLCYYELAKKLNEINLCSRISTASFQEHCKKRLMQVKNK